MKINSTKEEILNNIDNKIKFFIKNNFQFTFKDKIGLCVFYACKYIAYSKNQYFNKTQLFLEDIINTQVYSSYDIIDGVSGVVWLVKFLEKTGLIEQNRIILNSVEYSIAEDVRNCLIYDNWDYYHGAMGRAVVLNNEDNYKIIIDYFIKKITTNERPNIFLSEYYKTSMNMGLHAGILGILSFVNLVASKNLFIEECSYIRTVVLDTIINKLDNCNWEFYPALFDRSYPARMCWSYGELILALQLFITGNKTGEDWISKKAIKVLQLATKRNSLEQSFVQDSCILNGAVGNYYIYKMLNKLDNCHRYIESENVWLQLTLQILKKNGFSTLNRYTNLPVNDFSIISGIIGVFLAITDFDIEWSDYLLI